MTRLLFGDDQGIYTGINEARDKTPTSIGTAANPFGTRNGNLQITQFYYGAVQPSAQDLNGQVYAALLYGSSFQNGGLQSTGTILDTGDTNWNGYDSGITVGGVATDQQGTGAVFQYVFPVAGTRPGHRLLPVRRQWQLRPGQPRRRRARSAAPTA